VSGPHIRSLTFEPDRELVLGGAWQVENAVA
jgi:hypothetical protein